MSQTVSEETTNHNNAQDDISSLTSASSNSNKGPSTKLVWFSYKGKPYCVRVNANLMVLDALKEACAMFGITAYGRYSFVTNIEKGYFLGVDVPVAYLETSKTGHLRVLKETFKDEEEQDSGEFFGQLSSTVCSWFSSLSTTFKPASEKVEQTSTTGPQSSFSSLPASLESNSSKESSSDMFIPTQQPQNDNLRKRK